MAKAMGTFRDSWALLRSPGPGPMYRLNPPLIGPAGSYNYVCGRQVGYRTWGNEILSLFYLSYYKRK